MAEYLTNTTDLTKVASAIREKGGTSDPLVYPDGFVTAIGNIQTGVAKPKWVESTMTYLQWAYVCYGDGKFVAVSQENTIAAYSTDGVNWTQTTLPVSENWNSVCFGNGKFVAVAWGSDIAAYLKDSFDEWE